MYAEGLPPDVQLNAVTRDGRLPFVFEASGSETHFTNGYDPHPRARRIFAFPQPATLARTLRDAAADEAHPTWRGKVQALPTLGEAPLRPAQIVGLDGTPRHRQSRNHCPEFAGLLKSDVLPTDVLTLTGVTPPLSRRSV